MAKRRVELGSTGDEVRANLRRLRDRAGYSLQDLSERLTEAGRPLSGNTLSEIELGARRVDVDDLAALAVALGVMPNALLLRNSARRGETTQITGAGEVDALRAWDWADGIRPLPVALSTPANAELLNESEHDLLFQMNARPPGRPLPWISEVETRSVLELVRAFARLDPKLADVLLDSPMVKRLASRLEPDGER